MTRWQRRVRSGIVGMPAMRGWDCILYKIDAIIPTGEELCMYCRNNTACFDGQDGSSARTGTRARELYCTAINLSKEKSPHKTSVPVPYSDRNVDNNRNSGSGARGEVVSFPVQNEEPEVAAAAINTGLALMLLFGVVFFLTGIPLFV